jgi:hypothetical protein
VVELSVARLPSRTRGGWWFTAFVSATSTFLLREPPPCQADEPSNELPARIAWGQLVGAPTTWRVPVTNGP